MLDHALLALKKFNFWDSFPNRLGFIRKEALDFLEKSIGSNLIKVLSGQRRVGKSYILRQLIYKLIEEKEVNPKNIFYLNLELEDFSNIKTSEELNTLFQSYLDTIAEKNSKIYLLIDEVQEIKSWEKILNSYLADPKKDIEIFITGSNSNLLSSELASYITGRYIALEVFPFSYKEYLGYHSRESSIRDFQQYLFSSHLPETFRLQDDELIGSYLSDLKDSILFKDIVMRYDLRSADLLEKTFLFLVNNIGNLFSINSIVRKLKSLGYKTSTNTIGDFLQYFEQSYLLHSCPRYDLQGKKILEGEKKYYLNDIGFRRFLFSNYDAARGKFLENYVFNFFKAKNYKIYVGKFDDLEVDFVLKKAGEKKYIQVAYSIADPETYEREHRSLDAIDDHWPKYLITMDSEFEQRDDGIKLLSAWDLWSLED